MDVEQDPLELVPMQKWIDLQEAFKCDWPRSVLGHSILETQREWIEAGFDYGFKVFCIFGDVRNGMVAINEKGTFYEIVIQCPKDDTSQLEEALRRTKVIDWKRYIIIPFAPAHIIECIKNIVEDVNVDIDLILPSESFIFNKNTPPFDVSLPPEITFGNLSLEHATLVDSKWPHRYPGSLWYIHLLIKTKSGFGLFKNKDLVSWVFINEAGTFGQMFTLEDHRRKGYAEMLLKLICDGSFRGGKDATAFCVKGNVCARKLYSKIGFDNYICGVSWCYLKSKVK